MNQGMDFSQIPLRDIHLPGEVGWWPPAPGWWALLAIVLGIAVFFAARYALRYRQRAALRALRRVQAMLEEGAEAEDCLPSVSTIMRRFAMSVAANPRLVAGLVGEHWLRYLDSRWERDAFVNGPGAALSVAPYAPAHRCSRDTALTLIALCMDWVANQRLRN